jgi:hypothetical protein
MVAHGMADLRGRRHARLPLGRVDTGFGDDQADFVGRFSMGHQELTDLAAKN